LFGSESFVEHDLEDPAIEFAFVVEEVHLKPKSGGGLGQGGPMAKVQDRGLQA
jgi:hypothetical protein